jgi:ABC-2 type transport system ATP-binding protein
MIEVSGLSKRYGEITALADVTFSVPKGQIVGFLGANGAGKTTTMDILTGCIGADTGVAKIAGIDITENPEEAKKHLGYLPDEPPLYNDMRVGDYIEFAAKLRKVPRTELKSRVNDTIEKLSLGDVRHRLVGNLSKGYRQRVGLAQAIVHGPDVLVLDEPTEGLDPNQIVHIRDLIKSLAGQHTILLSSHILSEVQNTCDHIIIIHQGRIVQTGTYEEIVRGVDSSRQFNVQVAKDASGLAEKLVRLRGLSNVRLVSGTNDRVEFNVDPTIATLDDVARSVLEGGYGLRELAASKKSLEEVFLKITH